MFLFLKKLQILLTEMPEVQLKFVYVGESFKNRMPCNCLNK